MQQSLHLGTPQYNLSSGSNKNLHIVQQRLRATISGAQVCAGWALKVDYIAKPSCQEHLVVANWVSTYLKLQLDKPAHS